VEDAPIENRQAEVAMPGAKPAKTTSLYGVPPGVAMVQKWVAELKEKTRRSMEEWITLVKTEGPKDEKSRREWLKTKHKMGTNRCLVDRGTRGRKGRG